MARITLPIDVDDDFLITRRHLLDGIEIGLSFRWHERVSGWYLTIRDSDGVVRARGRRVEPGAELIPDRTWPTLPPGRLVATGTVDLTRREYLGTAVLIEYVEA